MKALVYHATGPASEVLRIEDRADPEPGPGEVLVRLRASGVNPHDTKGRSGWTGATPPSAGLIPHSDGAGEIVAVGPGVDPTRIGRAVYVLNAPHGKGTACGMIAISSDRAPDLPPGFSMSEGASIGVPAYTAWLAVLGDGPVVGKLVVVQGGGGAVGRLAVELAVLSGATVIATGRTARSRDIAAAKGAHHVLPVDPDALAALVGRLSPEGADRIVEVDFAANQAVDAAVIAPHGTVASYSCSSERSPVLDYYAFARKAVRLTFVQGADLTEVELEAATEQLGRHFADGRLRPDIAASFPFSDAAAAHELVEAGAPANVVVTID